MADLKISQFADGGTVQVTDAIAAVRAGANTKVFVGTAATLDAGTGISDLVQLVDDGGGSPQLPALDGSQLTGVTAGSVDWPDITSVPANISSIAGLTMAANQSIYATGVGTFATYSLTTAGRNLLDDATTSDQRTTLGLGTAATVNTGTSGAVIPLLNGNNAHSGNNTHSGTEIFSNAAGVTTDIITERTAAAGITADGVLLKDSAVTASGGILLNGGSLVTTIEYGTYTPTPVNVLNVSSSSANLTGYRKEVTAAGNFWIFQITGNITPTAAAATALDIPLPAGLTLSSGTQVHGSAAIVSSAVSTAISVSGNTGNNAIRLQYLAPATTARAFSGVAIIRE